MHTRIYRIMHRVACLTIGLPTTCRPQLLTLAILLAGFCPCTNAECSKVVISKTMWQTSREGTYSKTGETCTERYVYKQNSGDNYLYFIIANGGWRGWMVGREQCQNSGGIAVQDDALYPEDVTNLWEEVYNGNWYYSYQLEVRCYHLSSAAIAGIVIACLLVVGIIITIIVCCCKSNKRSNTVQVSHTPAISYTNGSVGYNGRNAVLQPAPASYYPGPRGGGYYLGPPAYGVAMIHGYGPPPGYTATATDVATNGPSPRPPSSPPSYSVQEGDQTRQEAEYPTKVST